jgi:hypothetical protein
LLNLLRSNPNTLVSFQVWAGPGTSSNQAQGFIVDWSSGAIKELPKGLTRYEISFYLNEHKERIAYSRSIFKTRQSRLRSQVLAGDRIPTDQ